MEEVSELLDLISHKLKYISERTKVSGLQSVQPILNVSEPEWEGFFPVLASLIQSSSSVLPKETDVLILMLEGKTISQMLSDLDRVMSLPGWNTCQAVLQQRVYLLDNQIFKTSNRLNKLEILAELIYPKLFAFGHEGSAWLKLNY